MEFPEAPRPLAYGDVWKKMNKKERQSAFVWDIVICLISLTLLWSVSWLI